MRKRVFFFLYLLKRNLKIRFQRYPRQMLSLLYYADLCLEKMIAKFL